MSLSTPARAHHGPPAGETAGRNGFAPAGGVVLEIDRRSHPAIDRGWDAVREGRWSEPTLSGLQGLLGARLLHAGRDWALIWIGREEADELRALGVRLNAPRPRPSEARPAGIAAPRTAPRDVVLDQSFADAVNRDEMMTHLGEISEVLQTRYFNTTGMVQASQYVFDRFVEYGLDEVWFDNFNYQGSPVRNVVGVKTGTSTPDVIYMICAHLDSTSPEQQTLAPGAEDNGSGSVGVLEAARLIAPLETDASVYFVCFTAEEVGLVGSEHLAGIAVSEGWDLRAVLNMDMVGFDTPGPPDIWLEGFYSDPNSIALLDLLEDVANSFTDLAVYRYPNDGWGSDHVPFHNLGFPSTLTIDYDWNNYSCYHQTCDVVENVVPDQLRRMVAVVTVAGAQLAGVQSELGSIDGIADRTDTSDDAGIEVSILGTGYTDAVSQQDGAFDFVDLLPGTYRLRAAAVGYETVEVDVTVVGGQSTPVLIPMDPLASSIVRGAVNVAEGGTALGAVVFATGQPAFTHAGEDGSYVLDPVYPGEVALNASYPDHLPAVSVQEIPPGGELNDVDFVVKSVWDFEDTSEALSANDGWEWGSDGVAGAHSGARVWGTRLGRDYINCADYRLDLPLDLRFFDTVQLFFWHWYEIESSYDGGNIQITTDGGTTWTLVVPEDGYPDTMTGSCNPLADQPGFGGTSAGWEEEVVDLSDYAGEATVVRFWFGSDGGLRERGWYLDDFSLSGSLVPTDSADGGLTRNVILYGLSTHPNPTSGECTIAFVLRRPAPTWVTIYDAGGRLVRYLVEDRLLEPDRHVYRWDGRDNGGRSVAAGVYWTRVFAGGRTLMQPVTVLR